MCLYSAFLTSSHQHPLSLPSAAPPAPPPGLTNCQICRVSYILSREEKREKLASLLSSSSPHKRGSSHRTIIFFGTSSSPCSPVRGGSIPLHGLRQGRPSPNQRHQPPGQCTMIPARSFVCSFVFFRSTRQQTQELPSVERKTSCLDSLALMKICEAARKPTRHNVWGFWEVCL